MVLQEMKYEQVKTLSEEQFRRLTVVKRSTFDKMVKILEEEDEKKKAKGERKNKLSIENQLLMRTCWNTSKNIAHIFI